MFGFRRLSDPTKTSSPGGINDDQQRVIVKDDSSDSVVSDLHDDRRAVRGEPLSVREQLHELMETQNFHIAIVVLVIFDCILVVTELVLDFQVLNEESKCNETTQKEETEVTAATVIHYMSLSILSIFMIELAIKIPVFGMEFWRSKLEVFDAIIIIASFVLDIVSLIFEEEFAALQLIVLLRLWRIVRVVNGVILSVETQAKKKIEQQRHLKEEVEHELEKFRQYCSAQEKEIEVLRNTLNQHGIKIEDDFVAEKPKIALTQLSVVAEVNTADKLDSSGDGGGIEATEEMDIKYLEKHREAMGEGVTLTNTVQAEYHNHDSSA